MLSFGKYFHGHSRSIRKHSGLLFAKLMILAFESYQKSNKSFAKLLKKIRMFKKISECCFLANLFARIRIFSDSFQHYNNGNYNNDVNNNDHDDDDSGDNDDDDDDNDDDNDDLDLCQIWKWNCTLQRRA